LKAILQRLWKDDISTQQLGRVSDGGDDAGSIVAGYSDDDDDTYDYTYDDLYYPYDI